MNLSSLNESQRKAVTTTEGAVLVLAGAGSGKTRVLTMRTAYILENGTPPYAILAVTFTNKAASEMRDRIEKTCEDSSGMWIGTFHSVCVRILRRNINKLGYDNNFSIYDEGNTVSVIKEILPKFNLDPKILSPKSVKYLISSAKNHNLTPEEMAKEYPSEEADFQISEIYKEYEKQMRKNNALDFDDLLLKTLTLLKEFPEVLDYYSKRFKYIMVDEYQDTNKVQYNIVKLLSGFHGNLFAVGDDDQSIYAFRGADIRNILEFEHDFENVTTIFLQENYRSCQSILDAANHVIKNNWHRKPKELYSMQKTGDKPTEFAAKNEFDEAQFIIKTCKSLIDGGENSDEIAILYRTNAQSRVIEEELKRNNLRYRIYGGLGFYDRKEIKDILAYLNLVVNLRSDMSFIRILNEPKRGIGNTTLEKIKDFAIANTISLFEAAKRANEFLNARTSGLVFSFINIIEDLAGETQNLSVAEFIDLVLNRTGYMNSLKSENTIEARDRISNLNEFLNTAAKFAQDNEDADIHDFLTRSSLISDVDYIGEDTGQISLMTLHSAKGLEFENVFIAGLENQLLPHSMSGEEGLEEERRLCYVGITRAKKRLYLTRAESRMNYSHTGASATMRVRSVFLDEIPNELINITGNKITKNAAKPGFSNNKPKALFSEYKRVNEVNNPVRDTSDYSIGTKVYHQKFGSGIIKSINGSGNEKIAVVDFNSNGEKKMFLAFAPLNIL